MNICKFNSINLYLIGTNHFDLVGRNKLIETLIEIKSKESKNLLFVATEYPNEIYAEFQKLKNKFRIACKEKWTTLNTELLNLLLEAFMYEIEVSKNLFCKANHLALRECPINKTIIDVRINFYSTIFKKCLGCSTEEINELVLSSPPLLDDNELKNENFDFCGKIFREIEKYDKTNCYLIIIVGANHLSKPVGNSMKDIFYDFGFSSEIIFTNQQI